MSTWALHHGEALTSLRELPDECVAGLVTDPPYSSGGFTRGDRSAPTGAKYSKAASPQPDFAGDNRDQRGFLAWCTMWLTECCRVLEAGAPVCVFIDWRMLPTMTDAIQCAGFVWRGIMPWDKTGAARPQMGRFSNRCEYVVWGSKGPMPARAEVGCLQGLVSARSPALAEREHLTQKPLEVMRHVVRVVRPDGLVLDPFAGVATTGVAAVLEGRRFLGVEVSETYYKRALARLEGLGAA